MAATFKIWIKATDELIVDYSAADNTRVFGTTDGTTSAEYEGTEAVIDSNL